MRLWSVHPKHLDAKGLVALWREALLAKHVLEGKTKGYKHHPQLIRFKNISKDAINAYLHYVYLEAKSRGYNFDSKKISAFEFNGKIKVTSGQMNYEFKHLKGKVEKRDPKWLNKVVANEEAHPIFTTIEGGIESWEII